MDFYPGYPQNDGYHYHKTTKKDIMMFLQQNFGASEIVQIEDFETVRTRHICNGTNQILVLDKYVIQVPTSEGFLAVEYFFCQRCRKLIINKMCLDMC